MEFQASLSYRLRPCLKKKKSKNRSGIPGSYGNCVSFFKFLSFCPYISGVISKVSVVVYTSTNSVPGPHLTTPMPAFVVLCVPNDGHSDWAEVES